jgi:hypothetical protein
MAYHAISAAERCNIFLVTVETILPDDISRRNLIAAIRAIVTPGEISFLSSTVCAETLGERERDEARGGGRGLRRARI